MRNAETFVQHGWCWQVWADHVGETDYYRLKSDAVDYVSSNGGGTIRRVRFSRAGAVRIMHDDPIEIPARTR